MHVQHPMSTFKMANTKRPRGKNFDGEEMMLLTELVEKNKGILNSKLTNTVTNQRKHAIWVDIAERVSSLGKCLRSVKDVKIKWSNITTSAKKEFSAHQTYRKGTGGGPAPKPMDSTIERIVEIFKDSPNFIGLDGVESPAPTEEGGSMVLDSLLTSPATADTVMATTTVTETATVLADPKIVPPATPANFSDCCSATEAELPTVSPDPIPIQGFSQSQDKRGKELEVMPPLRRRTIKTSDLQRMQFEVLREQKRKLVLQCEHLELLNKKLRRELQE